MYLYVEKGWTKLNSLGKGVDWKSSRSYFIKSSWDWEWLNGVLNTKETNWGEMFDNGNRDNVFFVSFFARVSFFF